MAPRVQAPFDRDERPSVPDLPPTATGAPPDHSADEPPELDEPEFVEPQVVEPRPAAGPGPQQGQPTAPPATPPATPPSAPAPSTPPSPQPAPVAHSAPGLDTAAIRRSWPDVLAKVFELRRTTWTFVSEHTQVLDYDGERLLLGIATTGLANTFRRGPHATYVQQALIDVLGIDARVEGVPADGSSIGGPTSVPTIDPRRPDPVPEPDPVGAPAPAQQSGRGRPPGSGAPGRAPEDPSPADGATDRGGEPTAYVPSRPPATQRDWGSGGNDSGGAPSWATPDGPGAGPEPASPFARAKEAVAAEPDPDETPVADDSAISDDDEDIEGLGEVGVPVVERVLGGKVISEEGA